MYIKRIKLLNIRCLPTIDLALDKGDTIPRFIVVAGRNGAGKTSFLQAIALGVYGDHLGRQYASNWTKRGNSESSVRIELDLPPGLPNEGRFEFLRQYQSSSDLLIDLAEMEPPLFLVGYGPMRRLNGEASFHASRDAQSPEDRVITLFHEGAALREVVSWIQLLHTRKLEEKEGAQQLLDGVLALMSDGLLPDGGSVTKVDSDGIQLSLGVPQRTEFLHQSSDGYRTVVAMVLDLLRQLHHLQGLKWTLEGGVQIENQGVVLIDELDAHLHVSWQSTIGFWLKKHFPNIQFIVTTHSPFICQAADPGGLVRLPREDGDPVQVLEASDYYRVVHGTVDDAMLSTLFGLERTHSDVSQNLRRRLAHLDRKLALESITEAERQEREHVERQLPTSGTAEVSRLLRQLGAE